MASRSHERPLFTVNKRKDALMTEYTIVFSDGEEMYILAEDLEEAAWSAIDLAYNLDKSVKDIIPTYVKQQILSQQMESSKKSS